MALPSFTHADNMDTLTRKECPRFQLTSSCSRRGKRTPKRRKSFLISLPSLGFGVRVAGRFLIYCLQTIGIKEESERKKCDSIDLPPSGNTE